jgi:molecular chaperone DnaJ
MPSITEAYRVLNDPGRRALYDRSLGSSPTGGPGSPRATTSSVRTRSADVADDEVWDFGRPDLNRPARVPWRSLLLVGVVGMFGIVVLAQFSDGIDEAGPDGILRNGDCVDIEPNGDAREVECTGVSDLVVRAFIPFDGTCPGRTEPHRDRQGMGVACIQLPEDP